MREGAMDGLACNELRRRETYPEGWRYATDDSFARGDRRVDPVSFRGLGPDRPLGWSRWRIHLVEAFDTLSPEDGIVTLCVQRSEARVRRLDRPGSSARGQISLLPTSGSVWVSDGPVEFDQFYLNRDRLAEIHLAVRGTTLHSDDPEPFVGVDDPEMVDLLERAADRMADPATTEMELETWALEIGAWLIHRSPHYERVPSRPARLRGTALSTLLDHIDEHLAEGLTVRELAALVGLSEFHMVRAFRAAMGRTPHRYLLERRIDRARTLLEESGLPLAQIAVETGFASQAHFSDVFRKRHGIAPGRWRKGRRPTR